MLNPFQSHLRIQFQNRDLNREGIPYFVSPTDELFLRRPRGLGWMWWFGYAHEDFVGVGGVRRYKEGGKFLTYRLHLSWRKAHWPTSAGHLKYLTSMKQFTCIWWPAKWHLLYIYIYKEFYFMFPWSHLNFINSLLEKKFGRWKEERINCSINNWAT